MNLDLPLIVRKYVEASNRHDVQAILSCFSNDAVVHDEGEALYGKKAIEGWITRTIEKYKFRFKPLSLRDEELEVVVTIQVSGTFTASPVTLDYRFKFNNDKIDSLAVD